MGELVLRCFGWELSLSILFWRNLVGLRLFPLLGRLVLILLDLDSLASHLKRLRLFAQHLSQCRLIAFCLCLDLIGFGKLQLCRFEINHILIHIDFHSFFDEADAVFETVQLWQILGEVDRDLIPFLLLQLLLFCHGPS